MNLRECRGETAAGSGPLWLVRGASSPTRLHISVCGLVRYEPSSRARLISPAEEASRASLSVATEVGGQRFALLSLLRPVFCSKLNGLELLEKIEKKHRHTYLDFVLC